MSRAFNALQLRNPRILDVLHEQTEAGAGRNPTETAENLILDGVEHRREKRRAAEDIREVNDRPEPQVA